jgi:poly(3-hydroxybutyrate) depolymerase
VRRSTRARVGVVATIVAAVVVLIGVLAPAGEAMPASGRFVTAQYTDAQLTTVADQVYGTAKNHAGTTVSLKLDVYLPPAGGPAQRPLAILIHGGGFTSGDKSQMTSTAKGYARLGFVAVSLGYRTDPGANASTDQARWLGAALNAIDDGMEAVRWLRSKAATYGIDPTRISMVGSSAGGAIALGVGAADDPTPGGPLAAWSPKIRAAVSTGAHLTPGIDLGLITLQSTDAPALMFHYASDTVTGNTSAYARKTCDGLVAAGSRCTFVEQAGSGHTVGLAASGTRWTGSIGPFLWDELDLEHAGSTTTTTTTAPGSTTTSAPGTTTTTSTVPCTPDRTPFASTEALVRRQYLDLIGRQPTAQELSTASASIDACVASADSVIESLIPPSQTTTDARLVRLYHAYFTRAPDPSGLDFWTRQLASGRGLVVVAQNFATSSEFQRTYGSLGNGAFVDLVYRNVLGRNPDPSGRAFWVRRLDARVTSRGALMASFSDSSENTRTKHPVVQVWRAVRAMRQATPTTAELRTLTDPILAGTTRPTDAIRTVRHSSTYAARF